MTQIEVPPLTQDSHIHHTLGELGVEALYEKCMALAKNLWWSWHPEVTSIFRDIDPIRWRQLDHNPIALLREFNPETLGRSSQ